MGDPIACPVCTLFLRPGIKLADHLETHPKDQVIKALVLLASATSSSTREIVIPNSNGNNSHDETFSSLQGSIRSSQSSPLSGGGSQVHIGRPMLGNGETGSAFVSKGFQPNTTRQNLMIVNRRSTMVYHTSESSHHQSLVTTETLPIEPSPMQIFNLPHRNQNKPLPPPPAYRTAITQIRSQQNQNQSSPPYGRHLSDTSTALVHQNIQSPPLTPRSRCSSYQNPLDYTVGKSIPSRPPPSPSVLRYAESPVTAHYEERDNGDFLVQELPRHVVECVEKDNGEFSVIEKVVETSPSIVHIDEDDKSNKSKCNDKTIKDYNAKDDDADHKNNENEKVENLSGPSPFTAEEIIIASKQNSLKKPVVGLTVLSNVKLDSTNSFDIMENIMDNGQIIWSGIVDAQINPEKKGKVGSLEDTSKTLCIDKSNKLINESKIEKSNNKHNKELENIPLNPSSSAKTSVIRMVGSKEQQQTAASTSHNEDRSSSKCINNTKEQTSHSKRTSTRQGPKKLVIKTKKNRHSMSSTSIINEIDINLLSSSSSSSQKTQEIATTIKDLKIKDSIDDKMMPGASKSIKSQMECETLKIPINNEVIPNKIDDIIINDNAMTTKDSMETNDNDIVDNFNDTKIEEKFLKTEIENTALLPMIVHEPSLSNDETDSSEKLNAKTVQLNKSKEFSNLLDDCYTTDYLPIHLSNAIDDPSDLKSLATIPLATIKENIDDVNGSSSSSATATSFNSFPSTSSTFSKPSTSSSALHEQTDYQQQQHPHSYNDYPFSFLYTNDKNRLSPSFYTCGTGNGNGGGGVGGFTSTDEQQSSWNRFNATPPIFQQYQNQQNLIHHNNQFQDIDSERNSYIDLDSCKKINVNGSDGSLIPFADALNIRTDEKMPAKGEISEQESNGDIENSWSQPLYPESSSYRLTNNYENYVTRESWSLSNDEYFSPEDLKISPKSEGNECKTDILAVDVTTKRKPKDKKKSFHCAHCLILFPLLKERNAHLIEKHGYKRVNRRLTRESPPATITTGSGTSGGIDLNQTNDQQQEYQFLQPLTGDISEDMKLPTEASKIAIVTNDSDPTIYSRTKYDSIRAGVYRMLMNFNLSVLQQTKNVEVDKTLFETKSFYCFTCKRDFISAKLFDEHLNEHPAECYTCGRKFTRWTYFSLHLKRHLGWKDFSCSVCEKKFVIRGAMIEHMRMHTGSNPLKCKLCEKKFRRYSNLAQHKKICHSTRLVKKKDYVCHCGEVLPSKARFIWHKETHDTKPKCCPHCRDRFVHVNSLKRHIRLMHSDKFLYTQPVECPKCKQIYAKASLKAHMSTHSMDTQHECSICNKSFSTKWNLKIHSWVHANRTAKPFKCDQCVKAFVREIDYKNHINSHKHIKPFTCEYCGCKFIRKYNYMRHRREHHGQKKFSCDLCGKLFHRHYYLIEHRRTHTGERPYLCTICGKSSTTKTNHNKHLKIHHSRDPFTSEA